MADATRSFRDYFYVLTLASLPVVIMVWIAALVMSVPLAFTIALVTFVTSYVPYIGALFSGAFAVLISLGGAGVTEAVIVPPEAVSSRMGLDFVTVEGPDGAPVSILFLMPSRPAIRKAANIR